MKRQLIGLYLALLALLSLTVPVAASSRYTLITILHTNDMHGAVMGDAGGIARMSALVNQIRAEMPNVLLFDGGDWFANNYVEYVNTGFPTITAMNIMHYDAAVVGNHELELGAQAFKGMVAAARFPVLAANLKSEPGGPCDGVKPYIILNVSGVRVGVLGLTTDDAVSGHWASSMAGITEDSAIETAAKLVPELRKQVDVLVVVSHMGIGKDRELAAAVKGIDFIIGGHTHNAIARHEWIGDTLIGQAWCSAQFIGRIDFIVRTGDSGAKIVSVNGKTGQWKDKTPLGKHYPDSALIRLSAANPQDENIKRAYAAFTARANDKLAEVIGKSTDAITGKCEPNDLASETPDGNLMADALRESVNSDIALVGARNVQGNTIQPGPLTWWASFAQIWGYTEMYAVGGKIKGSDLRDALIRWHGSANRNGWCVSGMSMTYRAEKDKLVLEDVKIDGAPLDDQRCYTIALQSSVMSDLLGRKVVTITSDPQITLREAVINYIRKHQVMSAPALGRIKIEQPQGTKQ